MDDAEYLKKLYELIDTFAEGAEAELQARWETWDKKLSDNEMYEVIGGLLARQTTLAINVARAPEVWNPHIAPILHRAMADVYITLAWILEEPLERSRRYIQFGLGQQKLHIEHRKKQAERDGRDPKDDPLIEMFEAWCNSQRYTFLTEVEVGSWSGITTREMADQAGCLDFYNYVYQPFSPVAHSMWNHVGLYNLISCSNPLHRYHKVPATNPVGSSPHDFYLAAKYLDKAFRQFDKKMGVAVPVRNAFECLNTGLAALESEREAENDQPQ